MAIKGIELANELRKLADAVEQLEDVNSYLRPSIYFTFEYGGEKEKQGFIEFAKVMPKPFKKEFTETDLKLVYDSGTLAIRATIERNKVCKIVTPAQSAMYDCEALLSQAEIAQLGTNESESVEDNITF